MNQFENDTQDTKSYSETEPENVHSVEKILKKCVTQGRVGEEKSTWELEENLDCEELIQEFELKREDEKLASKPRVRKRTLSNSMNSSVSSDAGPPSKEKRMVSSPETNGAKTAEKFEEASRDESDGSAENVEETKEASRNESDESAEKASGDESNKSAEETFGDESDKSAEETFGDESYEPAEDISGDESDEFAENIEETDESSGYESDEYAEETSGDESDKSAEETFGDESYEPAEDISGDESDESAEGERVAEIILGATEISGQLMFLVKWRGIESADLFPSTIANVKFTQLVIEFYEKRLVRG